MENLVDFLFKFHFYLIFQFYQDRICRFLFDFCFVAFGFRLGAWLAASLVAFGLSQPRFIDQSVSLLPGLIIDLLHDYVHVLFQLNLPPQFRDPLSLGTLIKASVSADHRQVHLPEPGILFHLVSEPFQELAAVIRIGSFEDVYQIAHVLLQDPFYVLLFG